MKSSPLLKSLALLTVLIALVIGAMVQFQFRGWKRLPASNTPPAVAAMAAAYDKDSDCALMFGGTYAAYVDSEWKMAWSSETWKWDGEWIRLQPQHSPSPRDKHVMAYDENRDIIVLFGGAFGEQRLNDTWEWDGQDWIEKHPQHIPPARCCHAMAYDPSRKGVILYGGWDGVNSFFDDTWLWDGNDWTQLDYPSTQMSGHVLVQYPPENMLVSIQTAGMGTWSLTESGWKKLDIPFPPDRSDGRADYGQGKIVFFGGTTQTSRMNDTWLYTEGSWRQLHMPQSPSARFGHILFYDEKRESFILFGGADTGYMNDAWELKLPEYIGGMATLPVSDP